jgi:hypothetical protein
MAKAKPLGGPDDEQLRHRIKQKLHERAKRYHAQEAVYVGPPHKTDQDARYDIKRNEVQTITRGAKGWMLPVPYYNWPKKNSYYFIPQEGVYEIITDRSNLKLVEEVERDSEQQRKHLNTCLIIFVIPVVLCSLCLFAFFLIGTN